MGDLESKNHEPSAMNHELPTTNYQQSTTNYPLPYPLLLEIASKASEAILEVYRSEDFKQEEKADHSPLTLADKRSNEVIVHGLQRIFPEIPIVSEESALQAYEVRKDWPAFWLVDPLDGTKEFIRRNGEFTVNIALIEQGKPVFGLIHIPVQDTVYFTDSGRAWKKVGRSAPTPIQVSNGSGPYTAVGSRSHTVDSDRDVLSKYPIAHYVSAGSSLKFCKVAEASADIYYRSGPTMEWDTAAGHALVLKAGGHVQGLRYNKPNLLNGPFFCSSFKI